MCGCISRQAPFGHDSLNSVGHLSVLDLVGGPMVSEERSALCCPISFSDLSFRCFRPWIGSPSQQSRNPGPLLPGRTFLAYKCQETQIHTLSPLGILSPSVRWSRADVNGQHGCHVLHQKTRARWLFNPVLGGPLVVGLLCGSCSPLQGGASPRRSECASGLP